MRGNIYCLFSRGLCGCDFLFVMRSVSDDTACDDFLLCALWWLPFVFCSCLLMIVACDVDTHDCAIWACVYCLWTDRYILVLCSLVIIVCDRCFLTSIFIPLILSTCPIPNNYIAKLFFLLLWVLGTIKLCALLFCDLRWNACMPEEETQQRSLFSCFGSSSNIIVQYNMECILFTNCLPQFQGEWMLIVLRFFSSFLLNFF